MKMLPLTVCKLGEIAFIKKITGRDDLRQRLAEIGFVVGEKLTVITEIDGNLIVQVKECRVALNRDTALRIMI